MSFISDIINQKHLPLPLRFVPSYDVNCIMMEVCALLNSGGGWVAVGVREDGMVIGLPRDYSTVTLQQELTNKISPVPLVYVQDEVCDDKQIALLTVMKGSLPPYSYLGRYYISEGNEVVVPEYRQMATIIRSDDEFQDKWEQSTCMTAEVADLDTGVMNRIYDNGKMLGRVLLSHENQLIATLSRLRLISASLVSNGAVALFGKDVSLFLSQCKVRIQVMINGKDASEYQDMLSIQDNLLNTHQRVMEYFQERLPRTVSFADVKGIRQEKYVYPMAVVDEAVTNALIHRSYSGFLDEVTIFVYKDRIEISNPGEMSRNYIVKGKVVPHGSLLRNPLMAEVFHMAGLMEKTGRGLSVIFDGMQNMGYKKPVWKCSNGYTTLTLYSKCEKTAKVNKRILAFLDEHSVGYRFTKAEYMNRFGDISKITAQSDIKQMVELGLCEVKGSGPSTKYVLAKTYR